MLNKRQSQLLNEFNEKRGEFVKTIYLANKFGVTTRTIQNDIKSLKQEFNQYQDYFSLETSPHNGVKLRVINEKIFKEFLNNCNHDSETLNLNYKEDRTNRLLHFLFNQKKPVSLTECADFIFVSKSTISLDLKEVDAILVKYSLKIVQNKGKIYIEGLERDKRMCLLDNDNMYIKFIPGKSIIENDNSQINNLKKILVDLLVKYHYQISDYEFRDLLVWLDISLKRIRNFFILTNSDVHFTELENKNMELSKELFKKIENKFMLEVPEPEIIFFTMFLSNHSAVLGPNYLSVEITNFTIESLQEIDRMYSGNFSDDMDLSLALGLHCAPLISRAKNNVQLKNKMIVYVKQNFQYAFEIATFFTYLLSKRFKLKICEDETSFLAIYFNRSINEHSQQIGKKKLCVVTSLTRSAYFLLEQFLYNTFSKNLATITFMNEEEVEQADLKKFDIFFSTENGRIVECGLATKISCFPDKTEIAKMKAIIEGYGTAGNIIDMFDPRLFFIEDFETKEDVQKCLVKKAAKLYNIKLLEKEIELREQFGSTYFGNSIAILHPMHSIGSTSFIGEVILKKPIIWDDEGDKVRMVFLVCLENNNVEAVKTWNYISPFIFNQQFVNRLNEIKNFEDFKEVSLELIKNL